MEIDWDSGENLPEDKEIDDIIRQIAEMANHGNGNDWWVEAEEIAKNALKTALYNPKLLRDILQRLDKLSITL